MTHETIKTLSDEELSQVAVWAHDEEASRAEKRRRDTIAKIRELAGVVGVSVTINGKRGRPPKAKSQAVRVKLAK